MCLIVCSNNGFKNVPIDIFEEAYYSNPDGFGIMWGDIITKGLFNFDEILTLIDDCPKNRPVAIHFRLATHGEPSKSLSHPFETNCPGVILMHNGILNQSYCRQAKESNVSDTAIYALAYNRPWHLSSEWRKREGRRIGHNKLVFLDSVLGNLYIVNQQLGTIQFDCWFSNCNQLWDYNDTNYHDLRFNAYDDGRHSQSLYDRYRRITD